MFLKIHSTELLAAHLCWQVPERQSLQSPAFLQSWELVHWSPHLAAALEAEKQATGFCSPMHLCWQVPDRQSRQSPAVLQSCELVHASLHCLGASAAKQVAGSDAPMHLCWHVPERQSLQSPASLQSVEDLQASPHLAGSEAATRYRPRQRVRMREDFIIILLMNEVDPAIN